MRPEDVAAVSPNTAAPTGSPPRAIDPRQAPAEVMPYEERAPSPPRSSRPAGRGAPSRALLGLAAAAAVGVAVFGGIALTHRGSDPSSAASQAAAASTTPDTHDICVLQLSALVQHLVNNGFQAELLVNGQDDPFYKTAVDTMMAQVVQDRFKAGDTQALSNLSLAAAITCRGPLHDAVRPNYPTDGTYPQ